MEAAKGESFGGYEVVRPIGAGGMAKLYLCRKSGIGGFERHFVVKVVQGRHTDDEEFIKMFLDEARITARLNHPNLVQVFEIDDVNGLPYMVMEYVRGPAMHRLVKRAERRGDLDRRAMSWITAGICRGLHSAHNTVGNDGLPLGIVHRDVSLQNVLVSLDGIPKVIDFGVATGKDRLAKTEVGLLKGKLQYMAPEQLGGDGYDHRADVFATGVCLYRACVGTMPFDSDNPQALWRVRMTGAFQAPSEVVPDFPEELNRIVLKSLAKDPSDRYPTAQAMADDLEAFAGDLGQKEVAAWVNDLFPNAEEWGTTGTGHAPNSDRFTPYGRLTTQEVQKATGQHTLAGQSGTNKIIIGVVSVLALSLLCMGGFALKLANDVVGNIEKAPQTANVDGDAQVRKLIQEAEAAIAAKNLTDAGDALQLALDMPVGDVTLKLELKKLSRHLTHDSKIARGERALQGDSWDEAETLANELIEENPDDEEALSLLNRALDGRGAVVAVAEVDTDPGTDSNEKAAPRPELKSMGKLSLRTTDGARLFIDGRPASGRGPSVSATLTEGKHRLKIAKSGFLTREEEIVVAKDKTLNLDFPLQAEAVVAEADSQGTEADMAAELAAAREALAKEQEAAKAAEAQRVAEAQAAAVKAAADKAAADAQAANQAATQAAVATVSSLVMTRPDMPEQRQVRTVGEITGTLAAIESELLKGGFEASSVKGITSSLSAGLVEGYNPGTALYVYPRGTYAYIAQELANGIPASRIRAAVRREHFKGTFK